MVSSWRIFCLEILALVRSKTLAMLTFAGVVWMLAFPHFAKGDGTAEGARELYLHFSLGGVFTLLVIALLASATGTIARERAARRLQLTLVRPVRFFTVALGKMLAHVAVGAFVLAVACGILAATTDLSRRCDHVLSPVLPSPREEAKAMYDTFMADPNTPVEARRAKKEVVLRLLTQRALDHYQTIPANSAASWTFPALDPVPSSLSVRLRFTNPFEMRQDVRGEFALGNFGGTVSNITQAVLTVPLRPSALAADPARLSFSNHGTSALMLRPRKDVSLLVPADAFGWNLLRAYVGMVAVLSLIIAFGVFLSASLGRPVALFVAFVALIVGEMGPSVVERYPDELETNLADRIGLHITRFAMEVTRPVSSLSPLAALSKDECVESREVLRAAIADLVVFPALLSILSAFIMPRKQDEI